MEPRNPADRFQQSNTQVHCDLQGEKAILQTDTGVYYTLNEVGAFIWDLLKSPLNLDAIVKEVMREYEVSKETAEADVLELLLSLQKEGLVERNVA